MPIGKAAGGAKDEKRLSCEICMTGVGDMLPRKPHTHHTLPGTGESQLPRAIVATDQALTCSVELGYGTLMSRSYEQPPPLVLALQLTTDSDLDDTTKQRQPWFGLALPGLVESRQQQQQQLAPVCDTMRHRF